MLNAAFYSVLTCVVSQVGLGRVGFSVVFEGHKDLLIAGRLVIFQCVACCNGTYHGVSYRHPIFEFEF